MLHANSTGQNNVHVIHAFEFANKAARDAGTGYTLTSADVNKFAIQTDDKSLWRLIDDSPITWSFISFGTLPRVCVRRTTGQAIPTGGSGTAISWTTEEYDTDSMWAIGDPTKLFATRAGVYVFGGNFQWDGASGGTYRYEYILKNAAGSNWAAAGLPDDGAGLAQRPGTLVTPPMVMSAGDYVTLIGLHDFGSDRNFDNGIFWGFAIELT